MESEIGLNLRALRKQEGLSLRQLSARTGLSATLLSQVERGLAEPSLKTLRALSGVFGPNSSSLFSGPTLTKVFHSKVGERSRISSPVGKIQYERLTPSNGQIEVLRGTLRPGDWSSEDAWSHEAIECVYVLEGTLTVEVDSEQLAVAANESITFSSNLPHRYGNKHDGQVAFLLSVSPPTP